MSPNNKELIAHFIDRVWNRQDWSLLDHFLHPAYQDHSLPAALPANKEGLQKWIMATSASFQHTTIIEDQVTEDDKCVVKIRMEMTHVGDWRGIAPAGREVKTSGYRLYKCLDGKIREAWALVDGQTLESQLTGQTHVCAVKP